MKQANPVEVPVTQYLRPAEACGFAHCGRTWLHKQERAGKIKAYRPSARLTLYRRDELEKLIESDDGKEAA